jgi:hypothetical protein
MKVKKVNIGFSTPPKKSPHTPKLSALLKNIFIKNIKIIAYTANLNKLNKFFDVSLLVSPIIFKKIIRAFW